MVQRDFIRTTIQATCVFNLASLQETFQFSGYQEKINILLNYLRYQGHMMFANITTHIIVHTRICTPI